MKTKILFSFLLVFLSAWGALAAAPYCSSIHNGKSYSQTWQNAQHTYQVQSKAPQIIPIRLDEFSKVIFRMQNGKKMDTTSLRQEVKFAVATNNLKGMIDELQDLFGKSMKNRDKAEDGSINITSTLYLTVAKYQTIHGDEKSAKVRFRKYYTRDVQDIYWKNLKVSDSLKDKSWLETKVQHSDHDNTVFKPRLICWDRDIRNFVTDRFFDHKEQLRKRLLDLNPGQVEEVQNILDFFTTLYSNPRRRVENLFAKTEYERTSYSIKLPHALDPEQKIDIQITLDENIRLTRLADSEVFRPYSPDETVIEVKIPVAFANMTEADIQQYPGLAQIKSFVAWLTSQHNPKYPINKGKMSKIEKKGVNKDDYESSHNFLDILDDLDGP